ncbi:trihelix transcription factor ENAP2 [Humulus lupulus]|uniref:trihelix transcription factor ENAP2 n=1 Tax=Humulus lupulus TaxID=3486 RepID=UPI002B40AEC8|nr:trihelix transcription factor ENAP2 [Humulus lupulus]
MGPAQPNWGPLTTPPSTTAATTTTTTTTSFLIHFQYNSLLYKSFRFLFFVEIPNLKSLLPLMAMATTPPPPPPAAAASVSGKKPQPIPWTHQETVHLIQAYEEKWYSLKRGPLKSSQWEEVAVTVAARCGYEYTEPSKTAIQCRHKMEKLRQRYRAEKNRLILSGVSVWPYFDLMNRLERGPLPISARPMIALPYHRDRDREDGEDDEDEEEENDSGDEGEDGDVIRTKSRSIDHILKRPTTVNRFAGEEERGRNVNGFSRVWAEPVTKRPRETVVEEEEYGEDDLDGDEESNAKVEFLERRRRRERKREVVLKLAAEIRAFSERFVGMESMKMEIMKDTERCRREMETKRIEMILHSQNKIVDSITKAFRF